VLAILGLRRTSEPSSATRSGGKKSVVYPFTTVTVGGESGHTANNWTSGSPHRIAFATNRFLRALPLYSCSHQSRASRPPPHR
jgi:hypothetical protein